MSAPKRMSWLHMLWRLVLSWQVTLIVCAHVQWTSFRKHVQSHHGQMQLGYNIGSSVSGVPMLLIMSIRRAVMNWSDDEVDPICHLKKWWQISKSHQYNTIRLGDFIGLGHVEMHDVFCRLQNRWMILDWLYGVWYSHHQWRTLNM